MIRPKLTRKQKLFYYFLSFLIIGVSFLFYKPQLWLGIVQALGQGRASVGFIGTVLKVRRDNRVVVVIGDRRVGFKTLDLYLSPETVALYEIDTTPRSKFKGMAKYMKVGDHYELKGVWVCTIGRPHQKVWTWSVPRRIQCYFSVILGKFY